MTEDYFFRNALLDRSDGSRHRLISFDAEAGTAVLILVGSATALPYRAENVLGEGWQRSFKLYKPATEKAARTSAVSLVPLRAAASAAQITLSEGSYARIAGIVDNPRIYDRETRNQILKQHAAAGHGTAKTLLKLLREFWQGGQTQDALLGHWNRCGRPAVTGTGGRGRKSSKGQTSFQVTHADIEKMRDIVETFYFKKDKRLALTDTLQELHERHYTYVDGNGDVCLLPSNECPTYRQLGYFLTQNYPREERLRARLGDKRFEQNHRSTEGSIQLDCHGVAHLYEFDATIADVVLVSSADPAAIVGKPTVYLIIDRASRMIVGWYVGFENASYNAAIQAILTIGQDKEALCSYLGLPYDANDWVAHGILPEAFLADQGELTSKKARRIARAVRATLMNVPGLRPEWKALVECGFAMLHQIIGPHAPAYVRDAEARQRRAPNVTKEASLNLRRFTTLIVAAIIAHNKTMQTGFPLSVSQVAEGVRPIPRELYAHGLRRRMGKLDQMDFERVREELMPRDNAVITADGISFRKLFYSCPEAEQRGWLVEGRHKRKPIEVAFDYRLANEIIVYSPDGSGQSFVASLTGDSVEFKDMAFADVERHFIEARDLTGDAIEVKRQARHGYRKMTKSVIDAANEELKEMPRGTSRSSRRKDTAPARAKELAEERAKGIARDGLQNTDAIPTDAKTQPEADNVIALRRPTSVTATPAAAPVVPANTPDVVGRPLTLKERMAQARKQMELN